MDNIPKIEEVLSVKPQIESLEYVDKGGFKAVFKGVIDGKKEAIKLICLPSDDEDDGKRTEIIARVKREFDTLGHCQTSYLVKLGTLPFELIKINDINYVIYSEELIEGNSLRNKIKENFKPEFDELKQLTICLMESLIEINKLNLIHRDIKPGNIMATTNPDRPFILLDLGIAFKVGGTELTAQGAGPIGTLRYIAPELLNINYKDALDIRSDIYSSGITIFEYASGYHPLIQQGEDVYTTLYQIINNIPDKLFSKRNDLPNLFCKMIDRCIKKLPALRFKNPESILKTMEEIS